jgi:hypothetical protein
MDIDIRYVTYHLRSDIADICPSAFEIRFHDLLELGEGVGVELRYVWGLR